VRSGTNESWLTNITARRELAAVIRAGVKRRPEQAFGDYFVGRQASCALGAAYEGIYRLAADMSGRRPTKDLVSFFDCLEGSVRGCPVKGCEKHLLLSAMIVHLNDRHEWSRETIAAWLEQNGERTARLHLRPPRRTSAPPR
jgi:hypothetical protein